MKKILTLTLIFCSFLYAQKLEKLILSGPIASVSHPFLYMVESGALLDIAERVEFRLWNNPDELRALILKKEVDFTALPSNLAAILHNKGQDIELLGISIWGIFEILSRDPNVKKIEDLKGKELIVPFRADMPDIILQALLGRAGLNPRVDIKINYVASPPDALQMLLLRRGEHALLAEPATSMAMRKTGNFPLKLIAPNLYRAIDLQKEWGRLFGGDSKIPQAGIAAIAPHDSELKNRIAQEYAKALMWYKTHPKEAGELISKHFPIFSAEAISDSISHVTFEFRTTKQSQESLENFFTILHSIEPRLIGGKLPNAQFYEHKIDTKDKEAK